MSKTFGVAIAALVVGYSLGNLMPLRNFSSGNQTGSATKNQDAIGTETTDIPSGKGALEVTVVNSNNQPVAGIEIDVATRVGPPESWGVKEADTNGMANFELIPGDYYVYFNMNHFPSDYRIQPERNVTIQEGQANRVTIVLERN